MGDYDDDDAYEFGGEDEFRDEYAVRERTGVMRRDVLSELGILTSRDRPGIERGDDPLNRFYRNVVAIYPQLRDNGVIATPATANERDAAHDALLDAIATVPNARYKNPTAFIIGYSLTTPRVGTPLNAAPTIDVAAFTRVANGLAAAASASAVQPEGSAVRLGASAQVLPIVDTTVRAEDVLRYCRMWLRWRERRADVRLRRA
jgi:hypothetical protein